MLWHRVAVDTTGAGPEVEAALGLLSQAALQGLEPVAHIALVVAEVEGGFAIDDGGDRLATVDTARAVLDAVFARVHRRAFELASLKGWVRLHGAVVRLAGARFAVVGPAGAGKTTLALAALAAGGVAEGDESFLARGGEVVAVPRRFHVKPGSELVVPSAAGWLAEAPVLVGDPCLRLFDPTEAGLGWDLPVGRVDHVVLLGRHDGASSIEAASATEAAPHLLAETFPAVESRATIVREVAGLLRGPAVHRLANGPDGRAVGLLENVALTMGDQ